MGVRIKKSIRGRSICLLFLKDLYCTNYDSHSATNCGTLHFVGTILYTIVELLVHYLQPIHTLSKHACQSIPFNIYLYNKKLWQIIIIIVYKLFVILKVLTYSNVHLMSKIKGHTVVIFLSIALRIINFFGLWVVYALIVRIKYVTQL